MPPKCFQTLDNGQRCSAIAIHGSRFCRHHDSQAPRQAKEESREHEPLSLPTIVDKPSALAALNLVVQALGEGRIKRSVADTLLSAIKLANRLLTEIAELGLTVLPVVAPAHFTQPQQASRFVTHRPGGSTSQAIAQLAAARDPDDLVAELMAQSHELSARSPRPDPRFTRA